MQDRIAAEQPKLPVKSLPVHCVQKAEVILIHQCFVLCCQLWSLIWQVVRQLNMLMLALVFAGLRTLALLALHRAEASCQYRAAHAAAWQDS